MVDPSSLERAPLSRPVQFAGSSGRDSLKRAR
jgi:hypothetical protein